MTTVRARFDTSTIFLWSARAFWTLAVFGAAFLLWVGSPSSFHGHVVASATGWTWMFIRVGYVVVISFAAMLWFARPGVALWSRRRTGKAV